MSIQEIHSIEILSDQVSISLIEMISYAQVERTRVIEMVDAGLLEPLPNESNAIEQWQFTSRDVRRLRTAQRLVKDLGVNLSSAALILDLIEERDELLARVAMLGKMLGD